MTKEELEESMILYKDLVFRLAYNNTCDLSLCDDIVQETFLALYNSGRKFENNEKLKAWLIKVAINKSRNYMSSWWKKKRNDEPCDIPSPEIDKDSAIALRIALKKLKPDYRNVIFLHYYEGYSVKEISEIL